MERERELVNCLFCASPFPHNLSSTAGVDDGTGTRVVVKREIIQVEDDGEFIISRDENESLAGFSFENSGCATQGEHLKASFLLRNVLKIPEELARQLLNHRSRSHNLEGQTKLCSSCEQLALRFFETFQKVSELERVLDEIETEVKDKILESQDVKGPSTWSKIRRQAVYLGN